MSLIAYPAEISIFGIYFPPILFATILAIAITFIIVKIMFKYNALQFVWHAPLFVLAICIICTGFISAFILPT